MTATAIKHSAQRDAIKAYLKSTKAHPTAEMVYQAVRRDYPKVSLATVYRNLSLLVELGEAQRIATVDGNDRFDGDVSPHYHFICKKCNCVQDLALSFLDNLDEEASRNFGGKITGHKVLFYGICSDCNS